MWVMVGLWLLGCQGNGAGVGAETPESAKAKAEAEAEAKAKAEAEAAKAAVGPVVVYSGRGESLVGSLFARLEAETGVDVEVRYGDTPELVTLMLTEGSQSPADVIFAQDSGHLGALSGRGMLAVLDASLLSQVDGRFQDPAGHWIGTSGRARVLVYNPTLVAPDALPKTLKELADPRWRGRVGWSPGNGSFQSHVSALRHLWGEEETRAWLAAMVANAPVSYPKNAPQVEAVADGSISLGWVNHYYLHRQKTDGYPAANHSFPVAGDAGNILMLSGMGIRAGSPRMEAASAVVAWMVSEGAQTAIAQENFEYPTRPGVATHPDVPPLDSLHLATVDQAWLSDLGPTRTMLQELAIQ